MKMALRRMGIVLVLGTMAGALCASADTHYVSLTGSNLWPFASWESAAKKIQDAVDTSVSGDTVLIADGHYMLSNTVLLDGKNITLESMNGVGLVTIDGQYPALTNRCLLIQNVTNFVLRGISIIKGCTASSAVAGGGASISGMGRVEHCIFSDNQRTALVAGSGGYNLYISDCTFASNYIAAQFDYCVIDRCSFYGNVNTNNVSVPAILKGTHGTLLRNCLIYNNTGTGAAGWIDMENCTIANNHNTKSGAAGVSWETHFSAVNCIILGNTRGIANDEINYDDGVLMSFCCTRPQVPDAYGISNFTLDPSFVNASGGDFRLQSGSPCINTGNYLSWMSGGTDLLGNPRLFNGIVDRGAYESPSDSSPVNPVAVNIGLGVEIIWNSQAGIRYWIQASDNLTDTNNWHTIDQRIGNGGEMNAIYSAKNQPYKCFRVTASP